MTQSLNTNDSLTILRGSLDTGDALVLKSALEGNGIPAFLHNENMAGIGMGAVIRVDLLVRNRDKVAAERALANVINLPRADGDRILDSDGEEIACTQCGSSRIRAYTGDVPSIIPFLAPKARPADKWYHCLQCNHYFQIGFERFSSLKMAIFWGLTLGVITLLVIWFIQWLKWL